MTKIDKGKLSTFRPQENNANRHTERGLGMLSKAYSEVGYVAPMTAAADGMILDGSARLETAVDQFGDEAIIVHHTGQLPIIMVRDDIENANTPAAKKISYGANRIAQADLDFDPAVIFADLQSGVPVADFWTDAELAELLAAVQPTGGDWGEAFNALPDEDRPPFQQVTFTLHDSQVETVRKALKLAPPEDFKSNPNENSNGNALAYICEKYINGDR